MLGLEPAAASSQPSLEPSEGFGPRVGEEATTGAN